MTLHDKTRSINGLQVHYWEAGERHGRALLLLHGGTGDARLHWYAAMTPLAETFHVLAPDLPGFGGSSPLKPLRIDALLEWIAQFLQTVQVEAAVVVGNSLGGLLARLFAAAHPHYVPAVILVNGGGIPSLSPVARLALGALARLPGIGPGFFYLSGRLATSPASLRRMIHNQSVLTDEFIQSARAGASGFGNMMRMLVLEPLPDKRTPLVPTLLLWGEQDSLATLEDAERIQASIPGAELNPIVDCGHMPQLEVTDVFVWQVNQFLDNLGRPKKADLPGAGVLKSDSP